MKRLTLFLFFAAVLLKANAQPYIFIPDPAFRNLIDSLAPGSISTNYMNTSHPGVTGMTFMEISDPAVYDITGIQYFINLTDLYSSGHGIGYIPALPPSLQYLNLPFCPLTGLPALPASLLSLHVEGCGLSTLPALPANLYVLGCSENNLIYLPNLPASLSNISCNDNLITAIPPLPSVLNYFDCRNNTPGNPHTFLPALPNSLQNLFASGNSIYCLPNIPNNGSFYSDIPLTVCQPQGTPDTWYSMLVMPNNIQKELATSFSVNGKGYVCCGGNFPAYSNDLWEFNPAGNAWTQKASFPGVARSSPFSFSKDLKGYVGGGSQSSGGVNDFYEYHTSINTWTQKANYPGIIYNGLGSFVINGKGYVAGGSTNSATPFYNEFYEYDPVADTWTQKNTVGGYGRKDFSCFAIGNKGYICGGEYQNGLFNVCYAYDVTTGAWTQVANLPVSNNEYAAFAISSRGYIAAGQQQSWSFGGSNSLYEYDPGTNYWYRKTDIPGPSRFRTTGFTINGRGYVATGKIYNNQTGTYVLSGDIFEYTPATCLPTITTISAGGTTTFCNGSSVTLTASPATGLTYKWYKNGTLIAGASSVSYIASSSGGYEVVSTNAGGCSFTSTTVSVIVNSLPSATITPAGPTTFCSGGSVILNAPVATNRTYQWKKGANLISGATLSSYTATTGGNYKVIVTNTVTGCSKTTASATIVTVNTLPTATITPQGPTTFCAGGSVVLSANTGIGLTYKWKKGSNFISGATLSNYTATLGGNYKVQVTNSNGCSKTSGTVAVSVPCKEGESISSINDFDFSIYPNPNSGEFTIKFSNKPVAPVEIEMTDELGKVVKRFETNDETVVIKESNLAKGIYCLTARNNSEVVIKKINIVR